MEPGDQFGDRGGTDQRQRRGEQYRPGTVGADLEQGFGAVVADEGAHTRGEEAGGDVPGEVGVGFGEQQVRGLSLWGEGARFLGGSVYLVGCHPSYSFTWTRKGARSGGTSDGTPAQPKRPVM